MLVSMPSYAAVPSVNWLSLTNICYRYLVRLFESNGPLFIKVGQYLSTKEEFLPSDFTVHLKCLQSNNDYKCPEIDSIREHIPRRLVLRCLGAGSIAAVYLVLDLDTGTKYAVKVKHNDLSREISENHSSLTRIIGWMNYLPKWSMFSSVETLGFFFTPSLLQAMSEQQDFARESNVQNQMYHLLRPLRRTIVIPRVHYHNQNQIVQSYMVGLTIPELMEQYGPHIAVQALALLESTFFNMMRAFGFVHNDLHEGNFKFRVGRRSKRLSIIIYDFGYFTVLDKETHKHIRNMYKDCNLPDVAELKKLFQSTNETNPKWEAFSADYDTFFNHEKLKPCRIYDKDSVAHYVKHFNDDVDMSQIMKQLVTLVIRHNMIMNQTVLNIIFNMTYMIDYENKYVPDVRSSLTKQYYVSMYDSLFRTAIIP